MEVQEATPVEKKRLASECKEEDWSEYKRNIIWSMPKIIYCNSSWRVIEEQRGETCLLEEEFNTKYRSVVLNNLEVFDVAGIFSNWGHCFKRVSSIFLSWSSIETINGQIVELKLLMSESRTQFDMTIDIPSTNNRFMVSSEIFISRVLNLTFFGRARKQKRQPVITEPKLSREMLFFIISISHLARS